MQFPIKDFFSKFAQIRRELRIWSHSLKKPLMENFIFYAVLVSSKWMTHTEHHKIYAKHLLSYINPSVLGVHEKVKHN